MVWALLALFAGNTAGADPAEEKAVEYVKKLGGTIDRDNKALGKPVVEVDLFGTKVGDADIKKLLAFKQLRVLVLFGTKVTGAGLAELAPLKHLQDLELSQGQVTDEALGNLRKAGLLHALRMAEAGSEGGRAKTSEQVTELRLHSTQVTDSGLRHLASLKNLEVLALSGCLGVGDPGLKNLAAHQKLEYLNLNHTSVSDAGMKHLASIKSLKHVQLGQTKVTAAGVRELQKALPKCKIIHDPRRTR